MCRVDTNLVFGMAAGADQWPVQRNQQAEGGKQGFEGGHSVVPLRLTQTKSASSVKSPLFILPMVEHLFQLVVLRVQQRTLFADAVAEVEGVDEFFDEADDHGDHWNGSVDWKGGIGPGFHRTARLDFSAVYPSWRSFGRIG